MLAQPKIAPIAADIRERLAILLDVVPKVVSIKAKTPEGLGLDHVAQAHAIVLLESVGAREDVAVMEEEQELPRDLDLDLDIEDELNDLVAEEVRAGQSRRTLRPSFDTEDIT